MTIETIYTDSLKDSKEKDELLRRLGEMYPKHDDEFFMVAVKDFPEYAKALAKEEHGNRINDWPFSHVDWETAADELAEDFVLVTYKGKDYFACRK